MESRDLVGFIYIVGRGHSGSTLLDILLGHGKAACSLGELGAALAVDSRICSCGATLANCPFWRRTAEAASGGVPAFQKAGRIIRRYAHVAYAPLFLFAGRNHPAVRATLDAHRLVLEALQKTSGCRRFIDSSKGVSRALLLARFDPSARIIHLVRHPLGVVASRYRRVAAGEPFLFLRRRFSGRHWKVLSVLVAAASWTIGNLLCELVAACGRGRVVRLRYEDLCRNPEAELRRIGMICALDLEPVFERLQRDEPFAIGHNIGGNRLRHEQRIRLDPSRDRTAEAPAWARHAVRLLCWPLMARYGYSLQGGRPSAKALLSDQRLR